MVDMIKFLPSYCERGAVHHPGKTDVFFFYIPLVLNSDHHVCPVETLYRFSPAVSLHNPLFFIFKFSINIQSQ